MTNVVKSAMQIAANATEAASSSPVASTVEASSGWLESFTELVGKVSDAVWGVPLIASVLVTGLLLTVALRFRHLFNLKNAFRIMFRGEKGAKDGEVSQFGALCTALSATIGTGNIVGVATAIGVGGPGALFWMELAAFFGMATKYAEGLLAVKYREITPEGRVLGGPFYYIERGLGRRWKPLAVAFAFFGILAGIMGTGTITQIHGISSATQRFFDPDFGYRCHHDGCDFVLKHGKEGFDQEEKLNLEGYLASYGFKLGAIAAPDPEHALPYVPVLDGKGNSVGNVGFCASNTTLSVVLALDKKPTKVTVGYVSSRAGKGVAYDAQGGLSALEANRLTLTCPNHRNADGVLEVEGLHVFGSYYSYALVFAGLVVTVCTALVIIGGLKRIALVSTVIVPFMAIFYVVTIAFLLLGNLSAISTALELIVRSAFNPAAFTGGAVGSIFIAIQKGVARGIFSNEAGLGSAPIAAAAAKTNEPVRQGLVCMTGTFIDTIVICTMTGLAIVVTGAWEPKLGLKGVDITIEAFSRGLSFLGPHSAVVSGFLLMTALAFFAFTTILGWNYYSEKCLEYLVGTKRQWAVKLFRLLYVAVVFVGPYLTVSVVWGIADVFNGLMAFPNLIALVLLSPVVVRTTRDYFARHGTDPGGEL